jgi:Ca2+-dependent lipid-binding protein
VKLQIHSGKIYEKQDAFSKGDPYVKIIIDNNERNRTEVINNTLNPEWEESIYYYFI